MDALNDLLDDLTDRQLRDLLWWLWVNRYTVTRTNITGWRRDHGVRLAKPQMSVVFRGEIEPSRTVSVTVVADEGSVVTVTDSTGATWTVEPIK